MDDYTPLTGSELARRAAAWEQSPVTWVRDEGQSYGDRERVAWDQTRESLVGQVLRPDPEGDYEVESYAVDLGMAGGRWLRVQLRKVERVVEVVAVIEIPSAAPSQRRSRTG